MSRFHNLFDVLKGGQARHKAVILPESGLQITYAALREQIERAASHLAGLGTGPGVRIAAALPNSLAGIIGFFAASMAGTAAPLNPAYRESEFAFYLEDTRARFLFCPPGGAAEARDAARGRARVVPISTDAAGVVCFDQAPHSRRNLLPPAPRDIALVLHASGSRDRPECVPITHSNLIASALNIAATYSLEPVDVALCPMPLFHVHGLVAGMLATFASGGTVVVPARFNPLSFWRVIRDYGVTWYSAVPSIHHLLLFRQGEPRPAGGRKLRFVRSCGASLQPEMLRNLESMTGAPVLEAYGMTEAAHQICSNPPPPGRRQAGSVGFGTGVAVEIVDGGRFLPPGLTGEVVIRGPNVFPGYENNPEANANAFVDGWFRTGDEGYLAPDGYLHLTARLKELINRGGEKIAPREIDAVLSAHPSVSDAAAFGVPHAVWGEEVAAAVVLSGDGDEASILAHCRDRLADFKCPKKLYIVESIPRTSTGKIQRGAVAKSLSAGA